MTSKELQMIRSNLVRCRNYGPERTENEETIVLQGEYIERMAKAALDLIDEADLTCHRKNEEIPVGECPCLVCVLKELASSGGTKS